MGGPTPMGNQWGVDGEGVLVGGAGRGTVVGMKMKKLLNKKNFLKKV